MMTQERFISQGEDLDFVGLITDYVDAPVDLTTITYQLYVAIHNDAGTIVKRFATDNGTDIPGWETMDMSQANLGKFRVFLYSSETKPLKEGRYYVEVRLKDVQPLYSTDDGSLDVVEPRVYLFSLLNSVINNLLP